MSEIISKIKEKAAEIDVKQIAEDVKTKIEYLDMGTILGDSVRAVEKIDVKAIKAKVDNLGKSPAVMEGKRMATAVGESVVDIVKGYIGK